LHTFTVGAPLSFLDHHLKAGDSLHGEQLGDAKAGLQALGALLMQGEFARLDAAAESLDNVAELTDVDIAEAKLSKQLAEAAAANIAPLHAMLDFWRAMRWIVPGWPAKTAKGMAKLFKDPADKRALGLARVLQPDQNIISVLNAGKLSDDKSMFGDDGDPSLAAANALMAEVRSLAQRERFFHWWTQFPGVFGTHGGQGRGKAHGKGGGGGFDAVIGNPPWDRIKLQEVEWFAERDPAIAKSPRAADRKAAIAKLEKRRSKLWSEYQTAVKSAEDNARVLAKAGDFPLLGGGDVNLYSMFVERAQALVRPGGVVALLTPSGIAADKGAAAFFSGLSQTGRLGALFDFENKKTFFPDVHASFKFSALLFGGPERRFAQTRCAFYLHSLDEIGEPGRTLHLTADDFARVNPNTGAAPVFRHQRDADLTLRLYAQHPVLVRHARADTGEESATRHAQRAWPVKYARMFDMTNDSGLFLKPEELESKGWKRAPLNRWVKEGETAVPLYVGRMMYHFDHRAASVSVNEENLKVASGSNFADTTDKQLTDWYPQPQYWVPASSLPSTYATVEWALGFRDITNATNERTMVSAIVPGAAAGNTLPLLLPEGQAPAEAAKISALMLANFNAFAFDYIARQKAQGTHLNWYIVEQLPVISADKFDLRLPAAFAKAARDAKIMNGHHAHPTVADFVVPQVLALSYTAHDLAPFARDLGYVDSAGNVLPPIVWDEENRHIRRAALDALFFWLYGLNAHEARTVLNTFPIVRADDERTHGCFRTLDSILAWLAHCA
jgi:hypothetical protein